MDSHSAVEPARPDEQADALRLLFDALPPEDRERRVVDALALLAAGELKPSGLLVERGAGGVVGAQIFLPVPGAAALVWPPRSVVDGDQHDREDRLLGAAYVRLRRLGVKIAQSLLLPEEVALGAPLERNGFRHVTSLFYLRHDLAAVGEAATGLELELRSFDVVGEAVFGETLLATYEGTRDCPEISGVRTAAEILDGHRAQGKFDPRGWSLASTAGGPVGVLLLTEMPETGEWDLAYLGVAPGARRRGVGRALVVRALTEARDGGARALTLSIDGRNQPAWELYRSLGFTPFDRREVYLAIWPT
jgi:ribosomal protein S18 acetylase RimI-like enzyme